MSFFDLRVPLGWLFAVLGLLLVIAGLRVTPMADARSLGININLVWGTVMIGFALVCLWLARREARRRQSPNRGVAINLETAPRGFCALTYHATKGIDDKQKC